MELIREQQFETKAVERCEDVRVLLRDRGLLEAFDCFSARGPVMPRLAVEGAAQERIVPIDAEPGTDFLERCPRLSMKIFQAYTPRVLDGPRNNVSCLPVMRKVMGILCKDRLGMIDSARNGSAGQLELGRRTSRIGAGAGFPPMGVVRRGILTPYWGLSASKIGGL